jgi:dinuclear metal center YbgI/SA1388 family protein
MDLVDPRLLHPRSVLRGFHGCKDLKKVSTVKQIIQIIEEIAPKALALPGDPVGLQCGELDRTVNRLMVSLDATLETVAQAAEFKADLLVTHHPLLFEPLTHENILGPTGRTLARAIRGDLAIYSAHTNLDASPNGINASLASLLDLSERKFLQSAGPDPFKVVVFVPGEKLEPVRAAAFQAGAGLIGDYSGCSFVVDGVGTFRPEKGAAPVTGKIGYDEKVQEVRIEISVRSEVLGAVLDEIRKAHPYEEPAIDVYPTAFSTPGAGFGITGELPQRSTVGQVAARVGSGLKAGPLRLVGKKGAKIKNVAVCAGSGAALLDAAVAAGAELYITGDVKYHDARKAEDVGIHVLDVGHFAPERYGLLGFGKLLGKKLAEQGLNDQLSHAKESDPFTAVL